MPGFRPGGRPTFLLYGKKVGKETYPTASVPALRFTTLRATCGARSWAARQNSFRAARSSQTAAASQSTKFGRSTATKRSPCPVLLGAGRRGVDSRASNGLLESCSLSRYLVIYASGERSARASSYLFDSNLSNTALQMLYGVCFRCFEPLARIWSAPAAIKFIEKR